MLKVSRGNSGQVYFSVNPQNNEMLEILQDLEAFKSHISETAGKLQEARLLQFPENMQNLKLIIEFSDCIL